MAWVKTTDDFYDDPDLDQLSAQAVAFFFVAKTWCAAKGTDGFIPHARLAKLSYYTPAAVAELCKAGIEWLIEVEGGFQVRSYLKFNPPAAKVEETKKKRSESGSLGAQNRWQGKEDGKPDSNPDSKLDGKTPESEGETDGKTNSKTDAPYPVSPKEKNNAGAPGRNLLPVERIEAMLGMMPPDWLSPGMRDAVTRFFEMLHRKRAGMQWDEPQMIDNLESWKRSEFTPEEVEQAFTKGATAGYLGIFPQKSKPAGAGGFRGKRDSPPSRMDEPRKPQEHLDYRLVMRGNCAVQIDLETGEPWSEEAWRARHSDLVGAGK